MQVNRIERKDAVRLGWIAAVRCEPVYERQKPIAHEEV